LLWTVLRSVIARVFISSIFSFVISLLNAGDAIDVDLVYLSPGTWGTLSSPTSGSIGLPARLDIAEMLAGQYLKTLRMGV
jgi:hypothetical protein